MPVDGYYTNTSITNKEIKQLTIGGKEVAKIEAGNLVLYEKQQEEEDCLILTVTGSSFSEYNSSTAIIGTDRKVDWGDGTKEDLTGRLSHTYTDGLNTHVIKVYNVTMLQTSCFRACTGLISVSIPSSVTGFGSLVFYKCNNLVDYQLYWTIPTLTWGTYYMPNNTNTYFTIPHGCTANYVAKNFPSNKLIERSE